MSSSIEKPLINELMDHELCALSRQFADGAARLADNPGAGGCELAARLSRVAARLDAALRSRAPERYPRAL